MKKYNTTNINVLRGRSPSVLVVTDAISGAAYERGDVMTKPAHEMFLKEAEKNGFDEEDFTFVTPCPPIPAELDGSESKIGKFVAEFHEEFLQVVQKEKKGCKAVLTLGKCGSRQLAGKATQITKARGTFCKMGLTDDLPVLPLLGPFHVLRRPEMRDIYDADFRQLADLKEHNWNLEDYLNGCGTDKYRWTKDIQFLIDEPPSCIALDCETIGLDWHTEGFRILNVSITPKKGVSYVIPVDAPYAGNQKLFGKNTPGWMKTLTDKDVQKSIEQIKKLLSNPKVAVIGHNLKFDLHALDTIGVSVTNWYLDTMQMAFCIDENMTSKSLDDCARRWLPTHAGYADEFNRKTDKSRMDLVLHDEMLAYAGGDTDVTYRLAEAMLPMAKEDDQNYNTFLKVQMPSLRTFVAMEKDGVKIDTDALQELSQALEIKEKQLYDELLTEVPPEVLREFEGNWNFGSQKFLVACLFGPNGVRDPDTGKRLKPIKYTTSTQKLKEEDRIPSTSAKDHLPFFESVPFVRKLMQYSKLQKVRSTYVGADSEVLVKKVKLLKNGKLPKAVSDVLELHGITIPKSKTARRRVALFTEAVEFKEGAKTYSVDKYGNVQISEKTESSGFWQYLNRDRNTIHTSFLLHATNTGRTSSRSPNLQNTPKRGELAKEFRKIFLPPIEGWKFLELDYSQVELRVAAWMANEKRMIEIYKQGGDIHAATAAAVTGVSFDKFAAGRKDSTLLSEVADEWPGADKYLRSLSASERKKATVKQYCDIKRYQAKAVNFGYLYGMWWKKFKTYAKTDYGIDYTDQEAEQTRINFFRNYPSLERWHKRMKSMANESGYVRALHGSLRRLPNVESFDDSIVQGSERQAVNAPVQRFASDLGLIAVNRIFRDAPRELIRPVLFIHDAIVPCVHPDYVEEAASAIKYYMENPPLDSWFNIRPPFPLVADVSVGSNLGEMEELPEIVAKRPDWYQDGEKYKSNKIITLEQWNRLQKIGVVLKD
jgi:DNA polymerase I-like protein with 3'-5' exonuclease and polymerase domains